MTRAVFYSVLLLSVACSSSETSGPNGASGAAGAPSAGQPGSASGGASPSGGTGPTGGAAPSAGAGGAPVASGGAGGAPSAGAAGQIGVGVGGAAGAAGAAGSGGGANGGTAGGATPASVNQRGGDSARTSHWEHASLTKANASKMALDANFKANFAGEFASSPLFLAGATPGTGRFYAATTENDVYALDETTGATVWKHNIGAYRVNAPTCGGKPNHHGILSTPVLDATARVIYVAGAMADNHHEIHALSLDTGEKIAGFPIDVSKVKAGSLTFNSVDQNQRSALSLVNGILYVSFGGYCGDGGNYHGWVVAVDTKDPTKVGAWATLDRQAAIWAAGGLASDGNGVFAVTGNTASALGTDHSNSDSEEVIRITGLGVGHRDDPNLFLPGEWSDPMNKSDKDFGSSSPAVITVPNSTPSTVLVAPSKPGRVYFLDAANLGGLKGQFADVVVASTTDQSVYTAPSAYTGPSGVHVAISTGVGSVCPGGNGGNGNVMSILMQPGTAANKPPMPKIAWCAKVSTGDTTMRSPISTNSAGSADPIVWMMNGDKLNGFDGETGALLYDSGAGATPSTCSGVQKFTAPIAVGGRIVAGGTSAGQSHLCSWSVH